MSGHTTRKTVPTKKSHVNVVVADTDSWEQLTAKALDEMKEVESYVKNAYLQFCVPYVKEGRNRGEWGQWGFAEITTDIATVKNPLAAAIERGREDAEAWQERQFFAKAQSVSMANVWDNPGDEVWNGH